MTDLGRTPTSVVAFSTRLDLDFRLVEASNHGVGFFEQPFRRPRR
jgi:hypothetical protein